jgi:hypothetical protein
VPRAARRRSHDDAEPPRPPANLHERALLVERFDAPILYRIHRRTLAPLWFGPGAGNAPSSRFDDPECPRCAFGVCYLGLTREAAFAETFLRRPPVRFISRRDVDARGIAMILVRDPLRLVPVHGRGLGQLGATSTITSGPHAAARPWSRAIWEHPEQPDGLVYRCRHDDDQLAVALFDRARHKVEAGPSHPLRADKPWWGTVLDRYAVALVD